MEPDPATFALRWKHYRDAGDPLAPPPCLWGARSGVAEHRPSAFALLYEPTDFQTLDEFDAFCNVVGSAARMLAEHGPGGADVRGSWSAGEAGADPRPRTPISPDMASALIAPVDLSGGPAWAWNLHWEEARFSGDPAGAFAVVGRTRDGWATVFVVEAPVRSPFG